MNIFSILMDKDVDELFYLNVSRAFLTQIYAIAFCKDFFTNDHSFTREILQMSLDLLVKHIDIFTNKNLTSITIFLISKAVVLLL